MASLRKIIVLKVFFMFLIGFAAPFKSSAVDAQGDVREAIDRRAITADLLKKAVEAGDFQALSLAGLGGAETCPMIRPYLNEAGSARIEALKGLANCRDTASFDDIAELGANSDDTVVRQTALVALGFTTPEEKRTQHTSLVTSVLSGTGGVDEKAAALYGLMQDITYAGLSPDGVSGLNFNDLLDTVSSNQAGFDAAYLLIRLQGLGTMLSTAQVRQVLTSDLPVGQKFLLARVMGQLGNDSSEALMGLARGHASANLDDRRVAVSAVRALGSLTDTQSRTFLLTLLLDAAPEFQQLALVALVARTDADAIVQKRIWNFVKAEEPWLAVTALEGLVRLGDEQALNRAAEWLAGESFYKAFRAVAMLSGSDVGQAKLQNYLDTATDPVRARVVQGTLDPASVPAAPVRPTVAYAEAAASAGQQLVLNTTRGKIVIEMLDEAPYAAHNFLSLAQEGALDGMLWHRVIPGFVAQAGQRDNTDVHGTIREEWGSVSHEPGTVGVATAGPDTGSSQFFINLERNRHLDGRYTVFGRVISGMDAAYALQEGDQILTAETRGGESD